MAVKDTVAIDFIAHERLGRERRESQHWRVRDRSYAACKRNIVDTRVRRADGYFSKNLVT